MPAHPISVMGFGNLPGQVGELVDPLEVVEVEVEVVVVAVLIGTVMGPLLVGV